MNKVNSTPGETTKKAKKWSEMDRLTRFLTCAQMVSLGLVAPAMLNLIIDTLGDEAHGIASLAGRLTHRDTNFSPETRERISGIICPQIHEILEQSMRIDIGGGSPYDQSGLLGRWQKGVLDCAIDIDVDNNNWMYWYPGDWMGERCIMTQSEVEGIINFDTPEGETASHDLGDIVSFLNKKSKIDRETGICEPNSRR